MFEDEDYFSESEYYPHLTKMDSAINTMVARLEEGCDIVPTGYKDLDKLIGGWQKGDMVIIGGFPSSGKTSLALNFALNAARQGYPVVYFTMESASHIILHRLVTIQVKEPLDFETKDQATWATIHTACQDLGSLPFYIDDDPRIEYDRLGRKIQETLESVRDALVIVDYINIMQPPAVYQGMREQEISAISREIKITARELNLPIIAIAELHQHKNNRGYTPTRPSLNDLRESSSLEYDADIVLFTEAYMAFCGYDDEYRDPKEMRIIVAKNRRGYTGEIPVRFDKDTGLIEEFKYGTLSDNLTYTSSCFNDMFGEESDSTTESTETIEEDEQDSDHPVS